MGYWTVELDGRAVQVLDGSLSMAAAGAYGSTRDFLANVHEGDGKPIYDGRSPFHPLIRPATISEIRLFEARQAELARWEDENGGLVDMPETMREGCRACTLIDVFDLPDGNEVLF